MKGRRIPLIIGLLLALGTGVLLLNFLSALRSKAVVRSETVWVAVHDIPARVRIDADAVESASRSTTDLDSDAITNVKNVVGKYSLITIPAGSVMTLSRVGTLAAFALPARLPVGMRAISIAIDRVKGVSGLIQPGDRVDVIAVAPRVADETPMGATILRGALVLAMGNETETAQATPSPTNQDLTTVTLAVTPGQADVLASADVNTVLRLTLRSPNEPVGSFPAEPLQLGIPQHVDVPAQVQAEVPISIPTAAAAGPANSQPASAPRSGVTLIDGDRVVHGTGQP
jgi:pilus assembly protein CpaB